MAITEVLRSKFSDIPHTPTPWVIEEQWSGLAIKPSDGHRHTICKVHGTLGQDLADTIFILDAVNAHDELVAVLEHLLWVVGGYIESGAIDRNLKVVENAHAALAKARTAS